MHTYSIFLNDPFIFLFLTSLSEGHALVGHGGGLVAKSCLTLATPWTVAHQAPLFMGFFRQENWRGLLFPSPGDVPNPGIKPGSPVLQGFFTD